MVDALADWERFLHDRDTGMPPLVACSLLHHQFETIHPFLTGVAEQAVEALERAERLTDLQAHYRSELLGDRSNAGAV